MGQTISTSLVWNRPLEPDVDSEDIENTTAFPETRVCVSLIFGKKLPFRESSSDPGYTLTASENATLKPGERKSIRTGVTFSIGRHSQEQVETVMYGAIKGLHALATNGVDVFNEDIPSDYRGEIKLLVCNNGVLEYEISPGDKIAKLLFSIAVIPGFVETALPWSGSGYSSDSESSSSTPQQRDDTHEAAAVETETRSVAAPIANVPKQSTGSEQE